MGNQKPLCMWCGGFIPEERVKKEGMKRLPKFCNREHFLNWRKESGFYKNFSRVGLQAQKHLADGLGERPGNDKRRKVLDRVRNRSGRKTGRHNMNKPSYYGVTYLENKPIYNGQGQERIVADWFIVSGPCSSREDAEEKGKEKAEEMFPLNPIYPSAERATLLKNLEVASKSELRKYRIKLTEDEV